MNTEQIKNEILAKLEIEREVREQLGCQKSDQDVLTKKGPWAWLDSKLGLLLIGAIISGVLVPTFQFTQEEIKWRRQNRYDNLERQLGSMRESLKQFITVQALSAELYDLGLAVLDKPATEVDRTQLDQWLKDFRALQAQRIKQNAAFLATVFYFPTESQQTIRTAWNDLMRPSQQLQTLVGSLLEESKYVLSFTDEGKKTQEEKKTEANEATVQLDKNLAEVNQAYTRVLSMLRQQLLEVEYESSKSR